MSFGEKVISKKIFVVGIIIAILASSVLSTGLCTMFAVGPEGATGTTGATGATGLQGPKGDTGEQGPPGEPGLSAGISKAFAYQGSDLVEYRETFTVFNESMLVILLHAYEPETYEAPSATLLMTIDTPIYGHSMGWNVDWDESLYDHLGRLCYFRGTIMHNLSDYGEGEYNITISLSGGDGVLNQLSITGILLTL